MKGWKYRIIKRLVSRYKKYGSLDKQKGAGPPQTTNTEENAGGGVNLFSRGRTPIPIFQQIEIPVCDHVVDH